MNKIVTAFWRCNAPNMFEIVTSVIGGGVHVSLGIREKVHVPFRLLATHFIVSGFHVDKD